MKSSTVVFVGVKGSVAAIDKKLGTTLWQTKLKSGVLAGGDRFVTLLVEEGRVYAHAYGEVFCLDADNGAILWKNALEGLGYELASLAIEGSSSPSASTLAQHRKEQSSASNNAGVGSGSH